MKARLLEFHNLNYWIYKLKSFAAKLLPSKNLIKEFYFKNNELKVIGQRILRFLRTETIIDFS